MKKGTGKYSLPETVDATFAKAKYKKEGLSTVDVSSDLAKFARNNAIRKTLSTTFMSTVGVVLVGYFLAVSTLGVIKINPLTIVAYPAFSEKMDGGFLTENNVKIFASRVNPAPDNSLNGFGEKIVNGFAGYEQEIFGTNLNQETVLTINVGSDGRITFTENGQTITTSSVYTGDIRGEYTLRDEYLIQCEAGEYCRGEEVVILSRKNIIGTVW